MEDIKNNDEIASKQFEEKKNARNTALNFFEFIAACLIIFIHIRFPGVFGTLVDGLGRFGVPLFFTVSGFYLMKPGMTKDELRKKLKTRIFRVTKLLIFAFCIYFVLDFALAAFGSHSTGLADWLKTTFTINKILKLIIFNLPLFSTPNWFMLALIYSYLVIYIFANTFLNKNWIKYLLSSLLLVWMVLRLAMNITQPSLNGVKLDNEYFYRNWLTVGLPFICFGIILKQYEEKIKNLSLNLIIALLIICIVVMPLEYYLVYIFTDKRMETFWGNILCVFAIIALSIKKQDLFSKSKFINQKGNYTMFIYIFHSAVIFVLNYILNKLGLSENVVMAWISPLIVLVVSVGLAMAFNKILCIVKDRRHNKAI